MTAMPANLYGPEDNYDLNNSHVLLALIRTWSQSSVLDTQSSVVLWGTTKPDGTMRKIMDVSKIRNLGWAPEIDLKEGISLAYSSYLEGLKR